MFGNTQVQRGTHYLLHESALIAEIRSATDTRAKALGMKERRPKLLFKKYLFTKQARSAARSVLCVPASFGPAVACPAYALIQYPEGSLAWTLHLTVLTLVFRGCYKCTLGPSHEHVVVR